MKLNEQQLVEVRHNIEVVSKLLADRPDEVLAVMFELLDSEEAYDAAFLPPAMRMHRLNNAIERLQITGAQLTLLSHSLRSIA